jgi:hypothetical protein
MAPNSERHKERDGALTALNVAIDGLNLAQEISSLTPAKAVFGSVSVILTMVRVRSSLPLYGNEPPAHPHPGIDDE